MPDNFDNRWWGCPPCRCDNDRRDDRRDRRDDRRNDRRDRDDDRRDDRRDRRDRY